MAHKALLNMHAACNHVFIDNFDFGIAAMYIEQDGFCCHAFHDDLVAVLVESQLTVSADLPSWHERPRTEDMPLYNCCLDTWIPIVRFDSAKTPRSRQKAPLACMYSTWPCARIFLHNKSCSWDLVHTEHKQQVPKQLQSGNAQEPSF